VKRRSQRLSFEEEIDLFVEIHLGWLAALCAFFFACGMFAWRFLFG